MDEQDYRKEGGDVHLAYDTAMAEQVNQFSDPHDTWQHQHQHLAHSLQGKGVPCSSSCTVHKVMVGVDVS